MVFRKSASASKRFQAFDFLATLIAVVWWHSGGFNLLVFIGLGIFWLVKRQMPYDLI